ncbi:MAG: phosphotransferase [Zetaproteobacteria bacterium]|nr:phosphotransferase [Zetaproteobacteria bacterium]
MGSHGTAPLPSDGGMDLSIENGAEMRQVVPPQLLGPLSSFLWQKYGSSHWRVYGMHGGLSAKVYELLAPGCVTAPKLILRIIPTRKTLFEREREVYFAQKMACAGVAPEVIWYDPDFQVAVLQHIQTCTRLTFSPAADLIWQGVGMRVARLHRLPVDESKFKLRITDRIQLAFAQIQYALSPRLRQLFAQVMALEKDTAARVYAHHDLNPGNVLWDGARAWIIDWELAGLGDASYDLATLELWLLPESERVREQFYLGYGQVMGCPQRLEIERQKIKALAFYGFILQMIANHPSILEYDRRAAGLPSRVVLKQQGQIWAPFAQRSQLADYAQALLREAEQRLAAAVL